MRIVIAKYLSLENILNESDSSEDEFMDSETLDTESGINNFVSYILVHRAEFTVDSPYCIRMPFRMCPSLAVQMLCSPPHLVCHQHLPFCPRLPYHKEICSLHPPRQLDVWQAIHQMPDRFQHPSFESSLPAHPSLLLVLVIRQNKISNGMAIPTKVLRAPTSIKIYQGNCQ